MQNLLALNMLTNLTNGKTGNKKATPVAVGNSLFQNFLTHVCETSQNSGSELSLCLVKQKTANNDLGNFLFHKRGLHGTVTKMKRFTFDSFESKKIILEDLNDRIQQLGISSGQIILPAASVPKLISFLRQQGLGEPEINKLLSYSESEDGSLRMDKLLPQILGIMQGKDTAQTNMVVESKYIPQIQGIIFNMGLGWGEVKEVIEKSSDSKNGIEINRLSRAINNYMDKPLSEEKLTSLLEKFEIKLNSGITDQKTMGPELKNELMNLSNATSPDMQKLVKNNIAAILTEKGIPPQEIKSFLETLSVDHTKSMLKNMTSNDFELDKLLNQLSVKESQDSSKGGLQSSVLENINTKGLIVTKDAEAKWYQGKSENQPILKGILNEGNQKPKMEIFQQISENVKQVSAGDKGHVGKGDNKRVAEQNIKGVFGADINPSRTDADPSRSIQSNHPRVYINLPEPLPRIFDRMVWMLQAGEQKSRVMINPPELGRLDLELSLKQGHIQANLSAETFAVKEIIEANLNQLKQHLAEQGFTIDKFEVSVGLNDREFKEGELWASNRRKRSPFHGRPGREKDSLEADNGRTRPIGNDLNHISVHV